MSWGSHQQIIVEVSVFDLFVSRWFGSLLMATLLFGSVGCSTMVTVNSQPQGAKLFVRGKYVGRTPVKVKMEDGLDSTANYHLELRKEGYKTAKANILPTWSGGFIALDAIFCLPTLGITCYLIYFNGKTHESEHTFPLEPGADPGKPAVKVAPPPRPSAVPEVVKPAQPVN
jgi:hypothetical protein